MANENVLVKNLQGVETLGWVVLFALYKSPNSHQLGNLTSAHGSSSFLMFLQLTLLATDKTGTLTRNVSTTFSDPLPLAFIHFD